MAEYEPFFRELIPQLDALYAKAINREWLIDFIATPKALDALRYLAAPPVSHDDLEALSDVKIRASTFKANPAAIDALVNVLGQLLDPVRFPWVIAKRNRAEPEEIEKAVMASAALLASQRVATDRRNNAKAEQEGLVKQLLEALHFKAVPSRHMKLITDAPNPMEFCGQAKLGNKQGDVFARLPDKRLLAIECKVSNSEVNSFKRIMNDTVSKSVEWVKALGKNQVIPVAVMRGVFNPDNLDSAQDDLFLIWDHRLADLSKFITSIPPPPPPKTKARK